jgi:hypothetical protein
MTAFPLAQQAFDVVWFSLPPDGSEEADWEGLGAVVSAEGSAVVCNVPAFVSGVGLGDTVSWIKSAEGAHVATGILRDAGTWTFRVWLDDTVPSTASVWDVHRAASDLGCWVDIVSARLIAISATVDTAQEVANWLASAEASGLLQYETARANDKP